MSTKDEKKNQNPELADDSLEDVSGGVYWGGCTGPDPITIDPMPLPVTGPAIEPVKFSGAPDDVSTDSK